MTQEEIQHNEAQNQQIDLKALLFNYLRHWHWFAISIVVCLLLAFLYLRYATPEYESTSKVLIKDDKKGGGIDPSAAFADLDIFKSNQNINNEIEVLTGKTLMFRVLKELKLETTFFSEGNIKTSEEYGTSLPIRITVSNYDTKATGENNRITIKILDKNKFSIIDKNEEKTYSFGEQVEKPYATFTLTSIKPVNPGQSYQLQFNDLTRLAAYYSQRITVSPVNKDASVLIISLVDPVSEKAEAIIDKLIETYNRETIEDKNQIA